MKRGSPSVGTVLLVEDTPMEVELTEQALSRCDAGVRVEVARDGEEALSWLSRWDAGEPRPALVLLDLKLPRVSGIEVLRAMRAHSIGRQVPVVVLSTSAVEADIAAAYAAGASSYLVKPTDFDQFLELVKLVHAYWLKLNETT